MCHCFILSLTDMLLKNPRLAAILMEDVKGLACPCRRLICPLIPCACVNLKGYILNIAFMMKCLWKEAIESAAHFWFIDFFIQTSSILLKTGFGC
ncbi:hypothetical protein K1719_001333 [Acacia pycnantha]|nr:hypothetical protein K1719_001333 [Acacia pycnantha]